MQTAVQIDDAAWDVTGSILSTELATTEQDILASKRLRYDIFASEMGARLKSAQAGIDEDEYDRWCHHLLVRETDTGEIVGSTRILTDAQARLAGGFYSESEFDLGAIRRLPGRVMEVGRTCIRPDYRSGAAIGVLWSGLARFMATHRMDYMMGCASIGMQDGGHQAHAIMGRLREKHLSPEHQRVAPRLALPNLGPVQPSPATMPPLLKAYLRLGARICGEACWDPDFNVADVFILLDMRQLPMRYQRHFLRSVPTPPVTYEAVAANL
ncbi:MAG: GNAT family N-acetyltransferase [Chromatiales bacterium]|jgi:putative hemolysin|nr:GNAT family N-acetyltransferase [Chromatiales bacterium]MDX9767076.1 GNAT family N-acyltransferase [Ectothiorhodospiraceae bacterium]